MENLRAFMLVNSSRESGLTDFDFVPADVDTNSETAAVIVENGFVLRFRTADERESIMPTVTGTATVSSYQAFDFEAEPAPAPAPAAEPAPAPAALPPQLPVPVPAALPPQLPVLAPVTPSFLHARPSYRISGRTTYHLP